MSQKLILLGLITTFLFFTGCGHKINKQNLGPDEYFEYAKKKFDEGHYFDAITEFTVIVLKFSGHPVVDDAQYYLAESHFKQKEYLIAISEYQKLINDYPQSPYTVLAQFKIGMAYYKLSLRPELDQEYTKKAIRQFQTFVEEHPDHELRPNAEKFIAKLREKLAAKKMLAATTYRKMGVYDAAVVYYDIIISDYYDTSPAAEAYFWKGECLYKLEKYREAQNSFTVYLEKFPKDKHVLQAKKRVEEIDKILKKNPGKQAEADGKNNH